MFLSRFFAPRTNRHLRGMERATLLIAVVATLCALIGQQGLFLLDARLYDIGVTAQPIVSPDNVVILGIDEAFMKGQHPYLAPRDRLAQLLRSVAMGKPSVVVLDVFLDSRLDTGATGQDAQLRDALAAVKASGAAMLISDLSTEEMNGQVRDAGRSGPNAHGGALSYFRDKATGSGSVVFAPDADDVVRRMLPYSAESLTPMPLLAAQAYAERSDDASVKTIDWKAVEAQLQSEPMPINFCGPPGSINQIPAVDLLSQPFRAMLLGGKAVFIGSTYPQGLDVVRTPYSYLGRDTKLAQFSRMYGVEVLAQSTNGLLQETRRHSDTTRSARVFDAFVTLLFALLVAALSVRGTRRGILAATLILANACLIAILSARDVTPLWGYRFHPSAPLWIAVPLACAAAIAWREWQGARELQHVRSAFEAYVGPQVLRQLGGKMPELGGEVRPVTVLFCDIRGYSALAETMRDDPEALLRELNSHFSPLVGALQSRHAHVDNYVGDLIMALWCEPLSGRNPTQNARDAVSAALDIQRLVQERNETRIAQGLPPIEVGIGLHCGEAVVGNLGGQMGKDSKIHYTAIGDTVNLASRGGSATRQFDVPLLVTREIVEQCGDEAGFRWHFMTQTTVKGRQQPVDVFCVEAATTPVSVSST